jgi:hypothetical protein
MVKPEGKRRKDGGGWIILRIGLAQDRDKWGALVKEVP